MELAAADHISSLSTKCGTGARQRDECACGRRLGVNRNMDMVHSQARKCPADVLSGQRGSELQYVMACLQRAEGPE